MVYGGYDGLKSYPTTSMYDLQYEYHIPGLHAHHIYQDNTAKDWPSKLTTMVS